MGSHPAENICTLLDKVLSKWSIHYHKFLTTLMDNGSNMMMTAFKAHLEDVRCDSNNVDKNEDKMEDGEHEKTDVLEEKEFLNCEVKHNKEFILL